MNTNTLAKNYNLLSPEDRFRLVVAAIDREDEVERERLKSASKRITFSNVDYSPFAHALNELATLVLLELLEESRMRDDFLDQLKDAETTDRFHPNKSYSSTPNRAGRSTKDRMLDLCLVQSFKLQTKAAGWMLFCKRLGVSPFGLWQHLPGFKRLQPDLNIVDGASDRQRILAWVNRLRPNNGPDATDASLITAEWFADSLEAAFRERVEWWGGS